MARKKKGRDVSGWMLVDKPAGMTSTAVVNKVKWALGANKAGHAGTLDPAATGVLAVALGEATKTVPFITEDLKAYRFTIRLGQATNTDDGEGEVIDSRPERPTDDEILAALPQFIGDIKQVPPRFSAVKIDGQRAYKLARDGEDVELAERDLYVDSLVLIERPDPDHAVLEMVCGKGGYVRSIARDLGASLGCLAHVVTLRRIWSGPFEEEDCVSIETLDSLAKSAELDEYLLPLEVALSDLPKVSCDAVNAARLKNGNPAQVLTADAEYGDTVWVSHSGTPVAIGIYRAGMVHPSRVFVLS